MDRKSPKNLFKMIQKNFKVTFDSIAIIFNHSDHVTAKVDRGEPVQVVRMVMWSIENEIIHRIIILTTTMGSLRSTFAVTWLE